MYVVQGRPGLVVEFVESAICPPPDSDDRGASGARTTPETAELWGCYKPTPEFGATETTGSSRIQDVGGALFRDPTERWRQKETGIWSWIVDDARI